MKKLTFFVIFTMLFNCLHAQDFLWAKQFAGTATSNTDGKSIALDATGNIYSVGMFHGTADFDPGSGTYNMTASVANLQDVFISKLDPSGNFLWARQISNGNSANRVVASAAAVGDATGNIYITGRFYGTVDFDPGPGLSELTMAGYGYDIFIAKYNALGNFVWAKRIGGTSLDDEASSIAVDINENVYTTGLFFGNPVDFDPGTGVYNLVSTGGDDIFISKLDASGQFVWARSFSGTSFNDNSNAIAVGGGNVYLTGVFTGTTDFDPGAGIFNLTSTNYNAAFISKIDGSGNFVWAKQIGATFSNAYGSALTFDGFGNVYVTGRFTGTVDFDPDLGTYNLTASVYGDVFICRLNNLGGLVWAKQIGGFTIISNSIALDNSGNVFTTGYFDAGLSIDFDPGAGTYFLTAAGASDIFISKLDGSGNFLSAKKMGGTSADRAACIKLSNDGSIFTTGVFAGTADFDPNTGTYNLTALSSDAFISKLGFASDGDGDGYTTGQGDCDDNNAAIHPGATEICNGLDDDCDTQVDEGLLTTFYRDADGDSYGDLSVTTLACSAPAGYVNNSTDCNDGNAAIHPGATEVCNGIDDDCDGQTDEGASVIATITPSGTVNICDGSTEILSANTGAGYNFQWYRNNKILSGQTSSTLVVSTNGDYTVRITVGQCPVAISPATTIDILTVPRATISYRGNTDICTSGSLDLKAARVHAATYQWNKDAVPIPAATLQTYSATLAGSYTVTVIKNGCSATSSPVIVTNSCPLARLIKSAIYVEEKEQPSVNVYPNPSTGVFTVIMALQKQAGKQVQIYVTDLAGRIVLSKYATIEKGYLYKQLSMPPGSPVGIYLLRITIGQKTFTRKLIIAS